MESLKVGITGSREITDIDYVNRCIDTCLEKIPNLFDYELVSGNCPKGVDHLVENIWYANEGILNLFPANWKMLGISAGVKRNIAMSKVINLLIVIWDGKSPGTNHMLTTCKKKSIPVILFMYPQEKVRYINFKN